MSVVFAITTITAEGHPTVMEAYEEFEPAHTRWLELKERGFAPLGLTGIVLGRVVDDDETPEDYR